MEIFDKDTTIFFIGSISAILLAIAEPVGVDALVSATERPGAV